MLNHSQPFIFLIIAHLAFMLNAARRKRTAAKSLKKEIDVANAPGGSE